LDEVTFAASMGPMKTGDPILVQEEKTLQAEVTE
jgi:hypothetical protein